MVETLLSSQKNATKSPVSHTLALELQYVQRAKRSFNRGSLRGLYCESSSPRVLQEDIQTILKLFDVVKSSTYC